MIVGYARVSTIEQNIESQIELLKRNGCQKIYTDVGSGVNKDRLGLTEMFKYLRKGDTVLVYKNDRIFRSLKNMIDLIEMFSKKEINFKSISEPEFDTTSANGKFLLQIFAAVAEFERNLISERTKIGLENAKRRKKILGRPKGPKKETVKKYKFAKMLYEDPNVSIAEACSNAKISKATFYRIDSSSGNSNG